MTKIAFGCDTLAELQARLQRRVEEGERMFLTTRYLPKRHEEMAGGSLYWIIAHRIMARSPLLGFEAAPDGRTRILLEPRAIPVVSRPKRAHQGWRYLAGPDAPADLGDGQEALAEMPREMLGDLTRLGLV